MMPHGIGATPREWLPRPASPSRHAVPAIVAIIGNMTCSFAERRRAQHGAKLRAQDFRPVEPDANAAFAEEGIVLPRNRQIGAAACRHRRRGCG